MIQQEPILFQMSTPEEREHFFAFRTEHTGYTILDHYEAELKELCAIRNPAQARSGALEPVWQAFLRQHTANVPLEQCGTWAFFPWMSILVHYLPESLHHELRTARNRNLITAEEQNAFAGIVVGIAGLSVGSHAALTLAMSGAAHTMKLADPDTISGSNLNRLRYGFTAVGQKKADIVAQAIYEMNPYADLTLFKDGLNAENVGGFICQGKRLHVILEETDDLGLKINIREAAKRERIPVVMITDNGDGVIADVERYDLEPDLPLFAGRLKTIPPGDPKTWPFELRMQVIDQIVDASVVEPRMTASLREMGKTLYSWPQLGTAATLAGVVAVHLIRTIALKEPCPTKRTLISLKKLL